MARPGLSKTQCGVRKFEPLPAGSRPQGLPMFRTAAIIS
jgi:hypothetical protein